MRAQGQKRYYALNPKPLAGIASWLETFDVGTPVAPKAAEAPAARVPDQLYQPAPDGLAAAAQPAPQPPASTAGQPAAAALAGRPPGSPLSPAVVIPVAAAGEDKMPQQIGRTVGRAATKAADLLANLPKFGRRK
jgi:hypothetical protein